MKIVLKQIFYSINKKESTSYTRKKILINNSNYFIWIKLLKIYKNYLFYKKVLYIFNNLKILKEHMSKNRSRKKIERRGDNIGLFELLETKQKNFVFGITFLTFF